MKNGFMIAAALAACMGSVTVHAQEKKPVTGTATEVLGMSDAQVSQLIGNFSDSRQLLTQGSGEKLYQAVCQGCHMPQAQGAKRVGFYPSLAGNNKLAAKAYPINVVLNGLHGMPGFAPRMSDTQVAEVVNYVRTHFGNNFQDAASAQDVQIFRK